MHNKIKVVFCTDGIFPHAVGGMQRHSRLLIEGLHQTGEVDLVVLHPHQGIRVFEDLEGIEEIALPPLPGKRNYLLELYDYSKLVAAELEKFPEHIVYSQGLSVWANIKHLGKRTIINPHGLEPFQSIGLKDQIKTWPYRLIFGRLFKSAKKVVSLGGRLTGILKSAGRADNVIVLPNATNPLALPDAELIRPRKRPLKFLFVGRFAHNKGIGVLLEACQQLNQVGLEKEFQIDFAGKGPLFEEMKAKYPLPNANFLGFVTDEQLDQAYLDDDVFVLPTLFEGMPTVILEAMARAMPTIVTDTGATLELVDQTNGIIIAKNDVESLAKAMNSYLDMAEEEYLQQSTASLEKFQSRFTWKAVTQMHLALFRDLSQTS